MQFTCLHKLHAQGSKTLYRKHLILINQDDPAQEGYERIAERFCKFLAPWVHHVLCNKNDFNWGMTLPVHLPTYGFFTLYFPFPTRSIVKVVRHPILVMYLFKYFLRCADLIWYQIGLCCAVDLHLALPHFISRFLWITHHMHLICYCVCC